MSGRKRMGLRLGALAVGLAGVVFALPAAAQDAPYGGAVRIGMSGTLFRDTPPSLVLALMRPFGALMESQTGLTGKLLPVGDPITLGRQLADGEVQLGVFHGFEFAWARQQHPQLRPLMIAVNQDRHLRAFLVVRRDNKAEEIADLQGKRLALPRGTREHCRLFLQRRCEEVGKEPSRLFKITTPPNVEEALDDLVDDEVQAAVVDGVSLDRFKHRKPGRYARLRVVLESEVFPAGVVAYNPGSLGEETVRRFRSGMLNANRSPKGRQLMTLWKLTGFEPVPPDYDETLANIVKAYPPPPAGGK